MSFRFTVFGDWHHARAGPANQRTLQLSNTAKAVDPMAAMAPRNR
jgi:hypothetical protein